MQVYSLTNHVNSKIYVGVTSRTIDERWKEHLGCSMKKPKYAIHHAIAKYGELNFSINELQFCNSVEELFDAEKKWIIQLRTHISQNGYNMTFGGEGVIGHIITDEQKQKMSIAHKGKTFSELHCLHISQAKTGKRLGVKLTDSHKKKISIATKGKIVSEETKNLISNALKGKKRTYAQTTCMQVIQIKDDMQTACFNSIHDAARSISKIASASNILYCCKGIRKKAYGFEWKYA